MSKEECINYALKKLMCASLPDIPCSLQVKKNQEWSLTIFRAKLTEYNIYRTLGSKGT